MADHDFGLVVRCLEPGVGRTEHAADVAAIGEVDVLIALVAVHDIAGGEHIGVGEKDPGIAVGVGIGDMGEQRLAAAHFHRLRSAEISLLRKRFRCPRRRLVAGKARRGAGGKAEPDIVVRHDRDAVLGEVVVSAGVVAVEMGVDHVLDRQGRDRLDRSLDLVGERRELAVDHDDAVGADGDGDVAALAFQHVGLVAKVGGLDLDGIPVGLLLRECDPRNEHG